MPNNQFINLEELSVTTQALLSKINEQSNLKVNKHNVSAEYTEGTKIAEIEDVEIYAPIQEIDTSDFVTRDILKNVAYSGNYNDLINTPSLATVATSGSYYDLSNSPIGFLTSSALYVPIGATLGDSQLHSDGGSFFFYSDNSYTINNQNGIPIKRLNADRSNLGSWSYPIYFVNNPETSWTTYTNKSVGGYLYIAYFDEDDNYFYAYRLQKEILQSIYAMYKNYVKKSISTSNSKINIFQTTATTAGIQNSKVYIGSNTSVPASNANGILINNEYEQNTARTFINLQGNQIEISGSESVTIHNVVTPITGDMATNKDYVDNLITTAIGNINSFNVDIVSSDLPTTGIDAHTIYFKSNSTTGNNVYDEYMYINNNWELIGSTAIDLTPYAQSANLATVATSGSYNDLSNTPTLATVATSGDYDDLLDAPVAEDDEDVEDMLDSFDLDYTTTPGASINMWQGGNY